MTATATRPALTVGQRILMSAVSLINNRLTVERRPGFCAKVTRQIVEDALSLPPGEFYSRFVTLKSLPSHDGYWARDIQKSLRDAGYGVPLDALKPGDILCNHEVSKPYGHIGIYIGGITVGPRDATTRILRGVIENTDARRGFRLGGAIAITELDRWLPNEAFRLPESAYAVRK